MRRRSNRRPTRARTLRSLAACVACLLASGPALAEDVYSPGGWATLHRSAANRKLVDETRIEAGRAYEQWTALEGAAVLTAPTLSPDGQTLYFTTGRARGHANLHAFTRDGALRWQAAPHRSASEGVDPCAILSSPIVDRDGDVYVSDCNQLFAFHGDGREKWTIDLPSPRADDWQPAPGLPINAFTTAVFTRRGHLLGVTNFGDVVLVDRKTGELLAEPLRLPGHLPPKSPMPMPETLFEGGLIDPAVRDWSWQLLFGGAMRSANTPAVDLESGRIFVAATSVRPGLGALYGLDVVESAEAVMPLRVEIAFATDMGPGSGSSPALSPDARRVYVSDEEGMFYAIDAKSGATRWHVETLSTSAAAAVGADGTVYSLQANGPALVAIDRSGFVKWESDLDALARARLPHSWLLGAPAPIGNGNPTVVGDVVLLPVMYGYEMHLGRTIPWPVISSLVAIDAESGRGLYDVVSLPDDSTGITAVLPDGTILSSLGTAITSATGPLAALEWMLPGDRRLLRPTGGIQVSRPVAP